MRIPDFTNKKVVDGHLDRLDTRGVSRRDFVSLMSAGAAAGAMAQALGWPSAAVAAPNGKLAYMYFSSRLQYCLTVSKAVENTTAALGWTSVSADAELNSQHELDQYEQLAAAGGLDAVILNAPDGSNLKRISESCGQQKIWLANVWATLPWYTPFDASEYYTYYADPDDFNAAKEITTKLCTELKKNNPKGGKIIGLTGIPGHTTDGIRTRGRNAALKDFPEFQLVDDLPGNFNMEDGNKAALDLLTRHPGCDRHLCGQRRGSGRRRRGDEDAGHAGRQGHADRLVRRRQSGGGADDQARRTAGHRRQRSAVHGRHDDHPPL